VRYLLISFIKGHAESLSLDESHTRKIK
jgi:hypothetical protein